MRLILTLHTRPNPAYSASEKGSLYQLNTLNTLTVFELGRFLEEQGKRAFVVQPTTPYHAHEFRGVMSHRHAAVRASLGVFGKE